MAEADAGGEQWPDWNWEQVAFNAGNMQTIPTFCVILMQLWSHIVWIAELKVCT